MNWLAHLYLSEPTPEFRVGNLLPDVVAAASLAHLPEEYQRGIRLHRRIDIFTDTHPRVKACVRRFPAPYRRFGGILTDIYFDYFLARDWVEHSDIPLPEFIAEFYRDIDICASVVPPEARQRLHQMRTENWLGCYHHLEGIREILWRVSHRLRRHFDLAGSLTFFQENEGEFLEDFKVFFPELVASVRSK
jgi:acyl carrier protein phosphodiesterase